MHYVYILRSETDEDRYYTGLTDDLRKRLETHNAGRVPHTAKWKPWHLKTYVAFSNRTRAADFEQYLKSPFWASIREEAPLETLPKMGGSQFLLPSVFARRRSRTYRTEANRSLENRSNRLRS